ncbi:MAG: PP2C family protein-serine/threonine phosphatase [bacterium]
MSQDSKRQNEDPSIVNTIRKDLRQPDLKRHLQRDFKELKEYMLSEGRQERLRSMNTIQQYLYGFWWLLKSMILKLTPLRRLMLVLGLLILLIPSQGDAGDDKKFQILGGLLLTFVVMLEVKDKLVAQKELEAGHAVQKALMPKRNPEVPGWSIWLFTRSANEVGGDLVDFCKITNDRYEVAVGDVAGKGLTAALMSMKLQATVRALAPEYSSLSILAAKLNEIFCRDSLPSLFSSLVYLELQPNSGAVRFFNAGHLPPFVCRGTNIDKTPKGGIAMGLKPGVSYEEQQLDLKSGDVLILYSDGLTEAQNEQEEFFGEQRLSDFLSRRAGLPTEEFGERLVHEVDEFLGDARANDDLSLAVIKRM